MGKVQRKFEGEWIDVEEFEKRSGKAKKAKQAKPAPSAEPADDDAPDDDAGDVDADADADMAEAQAVLERGDYNEMGTFLARHRDEPTPKGTEARVAALRALIEG
jgi:hypothetical protein